MKIKKAQFENNDIKLPTVLIITMNNVHIYFDTYRTIGTEVTLKRGNTKVGKILFKQQGLKQFKINFEQARI